MRFALKLAILFIVIGLAPVAVVTKFAYDRSQNALLEDARSHVASLSVLKEDELRTWMSGDVAILESLASRPRVVILAEELIVAPPASEAWRMLHDEILVDHLAAHTSAGRLEALQILHPGSGRILVATDERQEGKFRESKPFFIEGIEATYVGRIEYEVADERLAMPVSTPIRSAEGTTVGVLVGYVDLGEMGRIIQLTTGSHESEDTYVINDFSFFVTEPRYGEGYALQRTINTDGAKASLRGEEGVARYENYRGIEVIGAYRWIDELSLGLLVEIESAEITAPARALGITMLLISAAIGAAVIIAAFVFSRGAVRPILRLTHGTAEIGRGNLNFRIDVKGRDEIAQLGHSFNRMTEDLQQVTASRDDLEREVSARRAAEKRLQETLDALEKSEQKYRSLFMNSMDAVWMTDTEGVIVDANPAAAELLGYSREELVGLDTIELLTDINDRERFQAEMAERGMVKDFELKLRRRDGTVIDCVESFSIRLDENGTEIGHEGIVRDVTALKDTQARLTRTLANLQRSNRELEQFAYVASHDLQEPLRMVSSYTQLLEKRYKDALDQDAKDFIYYAVDGANRMQRLINDLLAYSRVQTRGKSFEPTDLNGVLGQARANLQATIEESGAVVTNDELPVTPCDPGQVTSIFQNLLSNAIKFRGEDAPRIHVTAVDRGPSWEIRVRDNGIGIAEEYYERVFTIFQRLHARTDYPGTGIGLSLVKRIAERHGGTVGIESTLGDGATFWFTLPKNAKQEDRRDED